MTEERRPKIEEAARRGADGQASRARLSTHGNRFCSGHPSPVLMASAISLLLFGLVMIYSTTGIFGRSAYVETFLARRQVLWAVISVLAMIAVAHTSYHSLARWRHAFLLAGLLGLLLVFLPGIGTDQGRHAHRWLGLFGLRYQPSELAKLCAILVVASEVAFRGDPNDWKRSFLPLFGGLLLVAALVGIEPDLGTASFILATGTAILVAGGLHFRRLIHVGLPALVLAGAMIAAKPYIWRRIQVFLNPDLDPLGSGYQVRQSLIAIGSGGMTGLGLGAGRQKLFYLPDDYNDFILAIVGEELGFMGIACVVFLLLVFLHAGYRTMQMARDRLGYLIAFGATFAIGLQAVLNLAVVSACLPNKGIPLPFVSCGGSSLLTSFLATGLLLSVAREAGGIDRAADSSSDLKPEPRTADEKG